MHWLCGARATTRKERKDSYDGLWGLGVEKLQRGGAFQVAVKGRKVLCRRGEHSEGRGHSEERFVVLVGGGVGGSVTQLGRRPGPFHGNPLRLFHGNRVSEKVGRRRGRSRRRRRTRGFAGNRSVLRSGKRRVSQPASALTGPQEGRTKDAIGASRGGRHGGHQQGRKR